MMRLGSVVGHRRVGREAVAVLYCRTLGGEAEAAEEAAAEAEAEAGEAGFAGFFARRPWVAVTLGRRSGAANR